MQRRAFEEARKVALAKAGDLQQWGPNEMQMLTFAQVVQKCHTSVALVIYIS
jgi:hypothetical protein